MAGVSISQSEYRANPAISSTDIKRMAQSMAHFKYFQDNPEDNDTQALQFGRAYHKYCLEEVIIFEGNNMMFKETDESLKDISKGFREVQDATPFD